MNKVQTTAAKRLPRQGITEKLLHYQTIIESSEDAIFSKDLNGIVTSWNPSAEKMYGYKASEIVGQSINLIFPPGSETEFKQIMSHLKNGHAVDHYDTVRLRKGGQRVYISVSISPLKNPSKKVIGASVSARDISDRIEQEQRKDDFISIASHELKTPLTTIKGYTQILLSRASQLDPVSLKYVSKMDLQLDRITELLNNLLDVSRLKEGKIELRKEKFDLSQLIKDIIEDLHLLNPRHQIRLENNKNLTISADKYRLSQVLINLIGNAIKYSPKAKKIMVKCKKVNSGVEVSIEDFGIGIFKSDQKKVFDKFFQARTRIRGSFSGLGLGLYISAEIIKKHSGKIWVESVKGKGSTFLFILPSK